MLVERRRIRVANPRTMHVGLVGQDQCGGRRMNRFSQPPVVVSMGTDGTEHDHGVLGGRTEPRKYWVSQHGASSCVSVPADYVANVVREARNGAKFLMAGVVPEQAEHVSRDARNQSNVAEAVLGESQYAEVLVGLRDHCSDFGVAANNVQQDAGLFPRARLGCRL